MNSKRLSTFQINAVNFYAVDIFKAAGSNIDPNVSSIIMLAVEFSIVTTFSVLITFFFTFPVPSSKWLLLAFLLY